MKRIFEALLGLLKSGEDAVLCTVVSRTGSAPAGAGAQMLVGCSGRIEGTIGGGFAEKQAETYAMQLIEEKRSDVRVYALHPDGDVGALCGGEVTVHFAYVPMRDGAWTALAEELLSAIDERKNKHLAIDLCGGAPMLMDETENMHESVSRFMLPVQVGERAVIFGAGHCAQALCPVLASVGFRVTVYDCRKEYARRELFPQAEQVILGSFGRIGEKLALLPEDYVVVMTSGHDHDFEVLEQVLRLPLAYTGCIGSRKKTAAVNEKLLQSGVAEEAAAAVHAPIGLSIMAATPQEIAVSIAAEMILERAKIREKKGQYEKSCPMHG